MHSKKPLVLVILDGWGYRHEEKHNAIAAACTPHWDAWWQHEPHTLLAASGEAVGLPAGQMGNSEVGHMHIGAGRVIRQDFTRINDAIANGHFYKNDHLLATIQQLKASGKALHIMGLLSDGGVHSHQNHLFAILKLCHQEQFKKVYLHLFLDGRDTPPQSALASLNALNEQLVCFPVAQIASLSGRYYAMDRDNRWDRTAHVYRMLTEENSTQVLASPKEAIVTFYADQITDEFIPPILIDTPPTIQDGDVLFFFNFRSDRARQLTQAFVDDTFQSFERIKRPKLAAFLSMTQYAEDLPTTIVFPPEQLHNTLGELIAAHGLSQLRIAETEKYAHVTFFINGGRELTFPNENRILIPSPTVATYDLTPEMSALNITNAILSAINSSNYDLIICNFANADMVGHTGDFSAARAAVECLDKCLHQLADAILQAGGALVITADHGNAEEMFSEETQQPHTAHTREPVPFLYLGGDWKLNESVAKTGSLIDIAPTLLTLLNLPIPNEMSGHSLLKEIN